MVLFSIFSIFAFPLSTKKRRKQKGEREREKRKKKKSEEGGGKLFRGSAGASRPSA
jgi:hypothetical protein